VLQVTENESGMASFVEGVTTKKWFGIGSNNFHLQFSEYPPDWYP